MIKTYQFRLMPNGEQHSTLEYLLRHTCRLYNDMLSMRVEAYQRGGSVSLYDQMKELTHTRKHSAEHKAVWVQFQRGALRRLDEAYQGFFRRVKAGDAKAGFPKFQSIRKWKSLAIPEALVYKHGMVKIKGLGEIKCLSKRQIDGKIKTAQIKRDVFGWRVTIQAEAAEEKKYAMTGQAAGIDLGIAQFITASDGEVMANQQFLKRSLRHLRISQRSLARKQGGKKAVRKDERKSAAAGRTVMKNSRRYTIAKRRVAQCHWKVAERRRGYHWAVIHFLLSRYDTIAVEKLQVRNMAQNERLSRSILDCGWSAFVTRLACKAAEAGKQVIFVKPHGTSQECSGCGRVVPKTLAQRVHSCECGLVLDRDHNAARNILKRAGISPPPANVRGCPVRHGDAPLGGVLSRV